MALASLLTATLSMNANTRQERLGRKTLPLKRRRDLTFASSGPGDEISLRRVSSCPIPRGSRQHFSRPPCDPSAPVGAKVVLQSLGPTRYRCRRIVHNPKSGRETWHHAAVDRVD